MGEDEILSEEIQEVAEPVELEQEIDENSDVAEVVDTVDEPLEVEVIEQPLERDLERDGAFAKMRRELEEVKKKNLEYESETSRVKNLAKSLGFTSDDYIDEMEAHAKGITVEEAKAQRQAEEERVKALIENNPEFQAFKQHAQMVEVQKIHMADLLEIKSKNPQEQATKIQDISNFSKFAELRSRGYDVKDAYSIANEDILISKKVNAAKQNAINAQQKEHLKQTGGAPGTDTSVEIPSHLMEMWEDAFPGKSKSELKQKYNAALKEQEK